MFLKLLDNLVEKNTEVMRIVFPAALFLLSLIPSDISAATLSIHYGNVVGVEVTTKKSAMARNMLIGSLVGWAVGGDSSGLIDGAIAGFVVTSVIENDKRVFAYTISFADGGHETVAVDRPDLSIGHCAALERDGEHINLRPVSAVHCADDTSEHEADEPGGEHRLTAAEKCSAARTVLTSGEAGADVKAALRNMRAYCD